MTPTYSEMLSTLGYDALNIIFGINTKPFKEREKKDLIRLLTISEKDEIIKARIQKVLELNHSDTMKKEMLLSLLKDEHKGNN
ncbi:hypothetical protein [uncultured Metabacillus sp.]|uniref:hypothetical protein n=1 Tax=Metabacillus sp. Hm71 TaxID=3450743 RepID=UPI00261CDF5B|nr:hypothetical protein [uncultured Metabacillus sp.]